MDLANGDQRKTATSEDTISRTHKAGTARLVKACFASVSLGELWHGRLGKVRLGSAWQGKVRYVSVCYGRRGGVGRGELGRGWAWQGRQGTAWLVPVGSGVLWLGRRG